MGNNDFLKDQLITYLGNKRSLIKFIDNVVQIVKQDIGKDKLLIVDGFSGSGAVARYFKEHASLLITNDLEKYSKIINQSFLRNKNEINFEDIEKYTKLLNDKKFRTDLGEGIIEKLYAPKDTKNIQEGERCFYTNENAKIVDNIRRTIDLEIPKHLKDIFLSILLYKASVHNNTSGVFKGFYKGKQSPLGKFGGEAENALQRILGEITMEPIILSDFDCKSRAFQSDTNVLMGKLKGLDLVYYDPPYNQHPYGSNYHMLNTILDYVEPLEISKVAGIPTNWKKSLYNKQKDALSAFSKLIKNTDSKYIMISYNNEGFISYDDMLQVCQLKGEVTVFDENYPAFRASRNLKDRKINVTEYIFLIKTY
jgi:adenine-specific DNA-methyltransferase